MLKPTFNFDRLKEKARFRRQRTVKICLSSYHMASNEPDALYSNTHTYLDFCPLFKVTQLLDCRSRSFLTLNLGTYPTCFFSSVWTFKFHSFDTFFCISISILFNLLLSTRFDSTARQIRIILLSETGVYEILIHNF